MMTVKMEMTLPDPPEGYEYTGEVRRLEVGDFYTQSGKAKRWSVEGGSWCIYPTLRKVPVYQPPNVSDLGVEMAYVKGDVLVHVPTTHREQRVWENASVIGASRSRMDETVSYCVRNKNGTYFYDIRNVEVAPK